jgi:1-acyl-sn-glycerol-3-phosphate acyltransferase
MQMKKFVQFAQNKKIVWNLYNENFITLISSMESPAVQQKSLIESDLETPQIPYPKFRSHYHQRVEVYEESVQERAKRYLEFPPLEQRLAKLVYRLIRIFHLYKPQYRWTLYHVIMTCAHWWFRIYNKMEIIGLENVPKTGCIFILNHFGMKDVTLFLAAFRKPCGILTEVGNGFIADVFDKYFGFATRRGSGAEVIEKAIRSILSHSCYFANWAEGSINSEPKVMQGFSGIIRVYGTINYDRDRIPIVPVYMKGSECYHWLSKDTSKKIWIKFLPAFYFPRSWLNPVDQGGKSPREMIDYVMLKLARINGQKDLVPNWLLNHRKENSAEDWNKRIKNKSFLKKKKPPKTK